MDNTVENYEFMGKPLKDWDNQPTSSETMPEDKAIEMGILQPQDAAPQEANKQTPNTQDNKFTQTLDAMGVEHPDAEKEYQKLSVGASILDGAKAFGVEASHFFTPKQYELQYDSKTKVGESMKYITRYGLGALGFAIGGGEIGAGIKAVGIASDTEKAVKAGEFIQKLFSFNPIKTAEGASKLEKGTAFLGNSIIGGALPSALADYKFYNQDGNEGHLADVFGNSNNPLIQYLQTDEKDSKFEGGLKNAVEGFLTNTVMGTAIGVIPKVTGNLFRGIKGVFKANTEEEAKIAFKDVIKADTQLQNIGSTVDLLETVKATKAEADASGQEASELLRGRIPAENLDDADAMLKSIDAGNDIHVNEDGSYAIEVSNWQDAHKVSKEDYISQRGDKSIEDMNNAVKDTWTGRGWVGENEELNSKTTKNIVDHYKDKWDIDNKQKIKVSYVDGLKNGEKPVEGFTETVGNTIQINIDKNSPNPHAVLRSELEHARDIAKGEVPKNLKNKHFARYNGKNESEMSVDYVMKKSQARADKLDSNSNINTPASLVQETKGVNTPNKPETSLSDTKISAENEQLKLDFNTKLEDTKLTAKSSGDVVNNLSDGQLQPKTEGDILNTIKTVIEVDPEVSGHTWKDLAKDSENLVTQLKGMGDSLGEDSDIYRELLLADNVDTVDKIARFQIASTKILGGLKDKIQGLPKDAPIESKKQLVDLYNNVRTTVEKTKSSAGRLLNEQKVVNESLGSFADKGLSAMQKEGINEFTDLLNKKLGEQVKLYFTKAEGFNLNQIKQNVITSLLEKGSTFADLLSDESFTKNLNSAMDDILVKAKREGKLDSTELAAKIHSFVTEQTYNEITEATKLAPTETGMWKTFSNWFRGNVPAYYVHNLLSSPTTLIKNIASGGANSISFALRKMAAGKIGGGQELTQEGIDQFVGLFKNWSECWELSKQAFKNGDGLLTNVSSDTLNNMYRGLDNLDEVWTNGTTLEKLQSIHSVMTRAMGASDEFMSQLNYRSIAYAKSLGDARVIAKQVGKEADEEFIALAADKIFKETKFTDAGLPRDVDAYHEAKSILYQNSLTGKIINNKTGEVEQMRNPSVLMKLGAGLQNASEDIPVLKFIIPFIKTPTNILQMAVDHSALSLLSPETQRILKNGGKEAALAKAQIAMGSTSFMIGSTMAASGMITGGLPADQKERSALLKSGWRPYSFKVSYGGENHYVSYQGYEPIATILGTGADLVQLGTMAANPSDENKISKLAQQAGIIFANNFVDKAYFRTAVTQMNIVFNADNVSPIQLQNNLGAVLAGAVLPDSSGVKNLSTIGRVDAKKPENIIQSALTGYLNRGLGEYKRNEFGEKESLTNLLLSKSYNVGQNPEDKELRRLAEQGYSPTQVSKVYSELQIKLKEFRDPTTKQTAYDAMQEEMGTETIGGKTLREAVGDLVMSDEYNALPDTSDDKSDETKTTEINSIYQDYIQKARDTIASQDNFVNKNNQSINEKYSEFQQMKQEGIINNQTTTDIREKLNSIF